MSIAADVCQCTCSCMRCNALRQSEAHLYLARLPGLAKNLEFTLTCSMLHLMQCTRVPSRYHLQV